MNKTESNIIMETILRMDRPFNTLDIYYIMKQRHNITNRDKISRILDELCESGAVGYSEIAFNTWAFEVVRR